MSHIDPQLILLGKFALGALFAYLIFLAVISFVTIRKMWRSYDEEFGNKRNPKKADVTDLTSGKWKVGQ